MSSDIVNVNYVNKNSYRYLIMLMLNNKAHCYTKIRSGKIIGLAISQFLQHSYTTTSKNSSTLKRKHTMSLKNTTPSPSKKIKSDILKTTGTVFDI